MFFYIENMNEKKKRRKKPSSASYQVRAETKRGEGVNLDLRITKNR